MVGVISIFTPTSWYWNCVLTSELTTRGGRTGLVGTGGDGNSRADLHGGLLLVGGADARALQDLGIVSRSAAD